MRISIRSHLEGPAAGLLAALGFLLIPLGHLGAQQGTITGQVIQTGTERPLGGAQVFIEGTTRGALANAQGRFTLENVPPGEVTVVAELIGFARRAETVTVAAGQTVTVDFRLSQTALALDQIVVTGAGAATERRKLGNTIASVDVSALENAPVTNLSEILTGREPGVMGLPSGGNTGEGARLRIRGSASLSQLNEPVIYVDGVRIDGSGGFAPGVNTGSGGGTPSRLDDLNPESIERVEILKGAAAATLYGTEASNGVIQIFTKRGHSGAAQYNVQIEQGFTEWPQGRIDPLFGFVTGQAASTRDVGVEGVRERWGLDVEPFQVFGVNPFPDVMGTGHSQTYSLSVSGGGSNMTYFVSGRFHKEDGPWDGGHLAGPGMQVANDELERRQVTANLEFFPRDDLRVRVTSNYSESHQEVVENNNNIFGVFSTLLMSKPEKATANNLYGTPAFATTRENFHRRVLDDTNRFGGTLQAIYQPTGNLSFDATFGVDFVNQRGTRIIPFGINVDNFTTSNITGLRDTGFRAHREVTLDLKGVWTTDVGQDWTSELVLGTQGFLTQTRSTGGTGQEFPGPGLDVINAGAAVTNFEAFLEQAQVGVMAQHQTGWRDFAFLTLGARIDEHSAFGETAGTEFYPKASLAVMPSSLQGWNRDRISTLRLRGAVGTSGLQPGAFDQFTTFSALAAETGAGVAPDNLGNPNLVPETSTEWELGAEVGVFQDRASLEFTYWNRTVNDALVDRQFSPSGGFRFRQLDNIGRLDAEGVEVGVNAGVYQSPNLSVSLFANGAFLKEVITDLGDAPALKVGDTYPRYRQFTQEGFAPGAFFGARLDESVQFPINLGDCQPRTEAELLAFFSQPQNPSDFSALVMDCGGPDQLLQFLGKPFPDWQGAFGGDVTLFGNVTVSSLFEFRAGSYRVHDLDGAFRRSNPSIGRNLERPSELEAILLNPASTAEERLAAADEWAREVEGLSPLDGLNEIHRADFIRFRELSIAWRLPGTWAERIGANNLSLTASGRNLALWTKFPGRDPEINAFSRGGDPSTLDQNFGEGIQAFGLPLQRRYQFAVRARF
jgi:TonB-dependent starch-binding outer membrane protein SusC